MSSGSAGARAFSSTFRPGSQRSSRGGRGSPRPPPRPPRRLDLVGVALASLALALIMVPSIEGRELGWPPWVFVALAAAVPAGALFVAAERRSAARGGAPLAGARPFGGPG